MHRHAAIKSSEHRFDEMCRLRTKHVCAHTRGAHRSGARMSGGAEVESDPKSRLPKCHDLSMDRPFVKPSTCLCLSLCSSASLSHSLHMLHMLHIRPHFFLYISVTFATLHLPSRKRHCQAQMNTANSLMCIGRFFSTSTMWQGRFFSTAHKPCGKVDSSAHKPCGKVDSSHPSAST